MLNIENNPKELPEENAAHTFHYNLEAVNALINKMENSDPKLKQKKNFCVILQNKKLCKNHRENSFICNRQRIHIQNVLEHDY